MTEDSRAILRIRHEMKFRVLVVKAVRRVTPNMVRVTLAGDELGGFASAAYDDHVKVFLPEPGQTRPVRPEPRPDADAGPAAGKSAARDYTPRRFDPLTNELDIDFVLHGEGAMSTWAASARPGQYVGIGGPRGSSIIPTTFDWYLLVGDETALPAIGRRLEELPAGSRAVVIAEVDSAAEEQSFVTAATLQISWLHRRGASPGSTDLLGPALRQAVLPAGDYFAWAAGETNTMTALRRHLLDERGLKLERTKAVGYWQYGVQVRI